MISKATIVGTGRVGSNIAVLLAKKRISHLRLYDSDYVGLHDVSYAFPFFSNQKGIEKVKIVKFAVKFFSKGYTKVDAFTDNISAYNQLDSSFCIIDCRDKKDSFLNFNFSVSLDGPFLFLDSTNRHTGQQVSHYIYEKDDRYLLKSMTIIDSYIENGLFNQKNLKLYDLRDDIPTGINMRI